MLPNDGRVVSNFIVQALLGEPITIHGDGSQTRSFCYVDDLVEGALRFMGSGAAGTGPLNLGNPEPISIRALAELILEMTASRSALAFGARPVDDPGRRQPDIARASGALGWAPKVPLRRGLERTIAYFDGELRGGGRRAVSSPLIARGA
jgi:UDP-glucuronate decarboxylase